MNLNLSEEQEMIRASVFDYFSTAYASTAIWNGWPNPKVPTAQPGRPWANWAGWG